MTPDLPRIFLVDDHQLFRKGLRLVLEHTAGFTVVGEAATAAELIGRCPASSADVLLADIHLPDGDGIEAARSVMAAMPSLRVIFLSSDGDLALVRRALDAGGIGYLLKDNAPQDLVRAIEAARKGDVYLCPEVATQLVRDYRARDESPRAARPRLSEREDSVLRLIAAGRRNKEIAEQLAVSVKSVETYRRRLLQKLGYTSTAEVVRHAIREGIISP
jgi:two-component system, NarL family, response regulator NreC